MSHKKIEIRSIFSKFNSTLAYLKANFHIKYGFEYEFEIYCFKNK